MFKLLLICSIVAYTYASGHTIPAAIKSKWNLNIRDVHLPQEPIEPQIIEVPALELPVKIIYNSRSSGVYVQQIHHPGEKGQTEATHSEEEPHRVIHEVVRPVIQELREVIVPYRRVVQEIQPVIEQVQTTVARGQGRQNNGGDGGSIRLNGGSLNGLILDNNNNGHDDGYGKVGGLWRAAKAASAAAKSRRA